MKCWNWQLLQVAELQLEKALLHPNLKHLQTLRAPEGMQVSGSPDAKYLCTVQKQPVEQA
jgi:hypothetical protein